MTGLRRYGRGKVFRKWCAFLLVALLAALLLIGVSHFRPLLSNLAATQAVNRVNKAVSTAVKEVLQSGEFDYARMVTLHTDSDGNITALQTNMAEINRLQALVSGKVTEEVSRVGETDLAISLGTLTGSPLLAGRGPNLKVRMQTVGLASSTLENDFTSTGINQTKHRIILTVEVKVSILLPGYTTYTTASGSYDVAETVIVGKVPETYTYFHANDTEDAEEYIMNNG